MLSRIHNVKQFPKPPKVLPVTPDTKGEWLVLIGGPGETSADEIEAFFAGMWPEVAAELQGDSKCAT